MTPTVPATDPYRLFIGTRLEGEACSAIRRHLQGILTGPAWRMAPEEQWHITALFIGDRSPGTVDGILAHMARLSRSTRRIQLQHGQLVTMPERSPTMLWVRFRPAAELTALHQALAGAIGAEPSGYDPYWPHITLARSRGIVPVSMPAGPVVLDQLVLKEITLFRSERGPEGQLHHPLGSWPLM